MKRILLIIALVSTASLLECRGDEFTVDMSKIKTDTNAPPVNLAADIAKARSENKLLLLEFSSSDSCPPCIVLQQRVLATPAFEAFAKSNLVFVHLDYPLKSNLRPDTTATNILLAQQFHAYGFPTLIALDRNGKEFWRTEGLPVQDFYPTNLINLLAGIKQKEQ